MESINTNAMSFIKDINNSQPIGFNSSVNGVNDKIQFVNDIAALAPDSVNDSTPFERIMNNCAAFKDMLSVAQGGISAMKKEGESIRDLIAQAREEGVTPELLDKIQEEVDARVAEIHRIRDNTNFEGVNPFKGQFSLEIPDILSMINAQKEENEEGQIVVKLADFDLDMSVEGEDFSICGSATIEIGYTADGALQINVDASMDYDLSGLVNNGNLTSDNAFEMINKFIDMLGVQQGDLGQAQNFLDAIIEQIFNAMEGGEVEDGELPEGIEINPESSNYLKGQMVQHASITLDGMAAQAPSIAINIL